MSAKTFWTLFRKGQKAALRGVPAERCPYHGNRCRVWVAGREARADAIVALFEQLVGA